MTCLHRAAYSRDAIAVQKLLESGAGVNARDWREATPLHNAACRAAPETCAVLLQAGAEVNARDRDGNTPLHAAVTAGAITEMIAAVCAVLLQAGAEVNAQADDGGTPLHQALWHYKGDAVYELLRAHGADDSMTRPPVRSGLMPPKEELQ